MFGLALMLIVWFLPGGLASLPARLRTAATPACRWSRSARGLAVISVVLGLLDPPVAVVPVRVVPGSLLWPAWW